MKKTNLVNVLILVIFFVGCDATSIINDLNKTNYINNINNIDKTKAQSITVIIGESISSNSTKVYKENEVIHATVSSRDLDKIKSYTWKDNGVVIGNESKFENKFPLGKHNITLEVVYDDGKKESKSFSFEVIETQFEVKKLGDIEDTVIVDNVNKKMWVHDKDPNKGAFKPIHMSDLIQAEKVSKKFCKELNFGGFEVGSWRIPTSSEVSKFVKDINKTNISVECNLLYANDSGISKVVATQAGVTNQLDFTDITKGEMKLGDVATYRTHYGIRCVRDIK